jgi:hypothetical protein
MDAMGKFTSAFFISPTYLQVISKLLESGNGYQKDPIGSTVAFASTGIIPSVGFIKDIVDIIDPIKRKKQESWDEFKALVPDLTIGQFQFQPGLRSSMEPFKTTDLQPTPLTATELYAPYGIGQSEPRSDRMYQDSILTKQQQKLIKEQLKPETERISKAQEELELAILQNDMQKANELASGLTKGQVGTVTERINKRIRNETLSPEERALYGLTSDQLNTLQGLNPGMSGNIDKIKNYKDNFESPKQSLFDQLKSLTKDYEAPKIKGGTTKAKGGKRLSVKKVGKKTVKAPKKTKIAKAKKIKPIKIAKLKPLKKSNV